MSNKRPMDQRCIRPGHGWNRCNCNPIEIEPAPRAPADATTTVQHAFKSGGGTFCKMVNGEMVPTDGYGNDVCAVEDCRRLECDHAFVEPAPAPQPPADAANPPIGYVLCALKCGRWTNPSETGLCNTCSIASCDSDAPPKMAQMEALHGPDWPADATPKDTIQCVVCGKVSPHPAPGTGGTWRCAKPECTFGKPAGPPVTGDGDALCRECENRHETAQEIADHWIDRWNGGEGGGRGAVEGAVREAIARGRALGARDASFNNDWFCSTECMGYARDAIDNAFCVYCMAPVARDGERKP